MNITKKLSLTLTSYIRWMPNYYSQAVYRDLWFSMYKYLFSQLLWQSVIFQILSPAFITVFLTTRHSWKKYIYYAPKKTNICDCLNVFGSHYHWSLLVLKPSNNLFITNVPGKSRYPTVTKFMEIPLVARTLFTFCYPQKFMFNHDLSIMCSVLIKTIKHNIVLSNFILCLLLLFIIKLYRIYKTLATIVFLLIFYHRLPSL